MLYANQENAVTHTTQQVVASYQAAFEGFDADRLMEHYAEDAILLTSEGACVGKEAIRRDFVGPYCRRRLRSGRVFERIVADADFALVQWSRETDSQTVSHGVSVLLIQDDLIQRQAEWRFTEGEA